MFQVWANVKRGFRWRQRNIVVSLKKCIGVKLVLFAKPDVIKTINKTINITYVEGKGICFTLITKFNTTGCGMPLEVMDM